MNNHTIRLRADGTVVHDLEIEDVKEGARERGVLVEEGGIWWRTLKTRKRFFLGFSEFSFAINWKE